MEFYAELARRHPDPTGLQPNELWLIMNKRPGRWQTMSAGLEISRSEMAIKERPAQRSRPIQVGQRGVLLVAVDVVYSPFAGLLLGVRVELGQGR